MKIKINTQKDFNLINFLLLILSYPVLLDFYSSLINYYNLSLPNITFIGYLLLLLILIILIIKYNLITNKLLLCILCIYVFFLINYIIYPYSRQFYNSVGMILALFFYLPISVFIIPNIRNMDDLFIISRKYIFFITLQVFLISFFLQGEKVLNYMEFSYSFLPFICLAICNCRDNKFYMFLSIILFISMMNFGARAPILFSIFFVICYLILILELKLTFKKLIFIVIFICLILYINYNFNNFISFFMNSIENTNSRFLEKLISGDLFISRGRDSINLNIKNALENMNWNIYGLFGDRYAMNSLYYSHNIIYEILLSFGWVLGSSIIIIFCLSAILLFFKSNKKDRIILFFFTVAFFLRYLISGSFIQEGMFYLFISYFIVALRNFITR